MHSDHAAVALLGIAACVFAVWLLLRVRVRGRNGARRDVPFAEEDPARSAEPAQDGVADRHRVLESLRQKLREGDMAARDGADDSIALPFLETEPHHHEVEGDSHDAEEHFQDTVPTFSWTRADD